MGAPTDPEEQAAAETARRHRDWWGMTQTERIRTLSYESGYDDGYEDGRAQGYASGLLDGIESYGGET